MSVRSRQFIGLAAVALALLWPVLDDRVEALTTPDRAGCPHSSDLPSQASAAQARGAVLCLLNQHRAAAGLPAFLEDPTLGLAAQTHAEDMGRRDFYAHQTPDGTEPDQRIRQAGYAGSTTGENIHWGVGANATPARIVDDWMASPGHRANILRVSFSRVGTGIGYDPPETLATGRAGVYVNNFGG
ncbi:MAG: hypothetical protein JWO90_1725 [Solirubrobacterales bacterium]|nr:hypothetical protein [Solirubrobacterales bacterium]